jgi:hypothetical protein
MTLFKCDNRNGDAAVCKSTRLKHRTLWRWACVGLLALVLVGGVATPASAHVRVFIGGVFGLPIYPYPYAYAAPTYAYPYSPYPVYAPYAAPLPPVWVGGRWASRHEHFRGHSRAWGPRRWR